MTDRLLATFASHSASRPLFDGQTGVGAQIANEIKNNISQLTSTYRSSTLGSRDSLISVYHEKVLAVFKQILGVFKNRKVNLSGTGPKPILNAIARPPNKTINSDALHSSIIQGAQRINVTSMSESVSNPSDGRQRPRSISDGPQPTPSIIIGGSPSSSHEKTHKALLDSPESPSMDINEKQDHLSLGDHSSSPSQRDRKLPPVLSVQGCDADSEKIHSTQEKGLELIPLQDDPDCLVVTVRSVLIGAFLSALGAAVTQASNSR
ncbi:hypothetical protein Pst134EA_032257 [Puccinia striiformis f. sp. tritici]|uniref:uncharacterized protein n=1 Tax=Puccinia striiformis f. sp. tritici TaxID=168172 RepID=UPI0020072D7B|nr:uncharacterized protein Pst134EA_032257 [Puccinia striiformis f. sp. tritici]KAH9440666.1 hypothetical protein Pst134EA_032257 [Puccinia striiformis f. sp. tritici]